MENRKWIIYMIRNRVNGKVYVGQTCQGIAVRWTKHRYSANCKKLDSLIWVAIRKHGIEAFDISQIDTAESLQEAYLRERFYIFITRSFLPQYGYNLTFGGEGAPHTAITRDKIRASGLQTESEFWNKVDKTGDGGAFTWGDTPCWLWLGCTSNEGYGLCAGGRMSRNDKAHRVAWVKINGPIPAGKILSFRCDHRICVNPDHHFVGTKKDNAMLMVAKGHQRMQKNALAKAEHGIAIRRHYATLGEYPERIEAEMERRRRIGVSVKERWRMAKLSGKGRL